MMLLMMVVEKSFLVAVVVVVDCRGSSVAFALRGPAALCRLARVLKTMMMMRKQWSSMMVKTKMKMRMKTRMRMMQE